MEPKRHIKTSKVLDPEQIQLSREPKQTLQLTIQGELSHSKIRIVRAFPLSHPDGYVAFLDEKDEEIGMVKDPRELDPQSRKIVEEELDRRYLASVIKKIRSKRTEFGTTYWDVDTDRGRRDFVIQGIQDNVIWLGERRLLLVDVDGNRFEIPDYLFLDKKSMALLEEVLF